MRVIKTETSQRAADAVASLFVLSLNEAEFRLGSGFASEECEDCCFRAGHVTQPANAIATDQSIDNGWRDPMLGEREDTIARATLINHQEVDVAISIVEQVAVSSDLRNSARSRGGFLFVISNESTRGSRTPWQAGFCNFLPPHEFRRTLHQSRRIPSKTFTEADNACEAMLPHLTK